MEKDFSEWHKKKTTIEHDKKPRVLFHEREVWWCSLGANIGFEEDGKGEKFSRPVLVFKKFNKEVFWALPLSTQIKEGKFYIDIDLHDGVPRVVVISQLRFLDGKRLIDKIGTIDGLNHAAIQKAVISLCSS